MNDKKLTGKYILFTIAAVVFTWIIHEFGHWLTAEALGYDAILRINGVAYTNGEDVEAAHQIMVSAAGPIITVFQALVVYYLLLRKWNKYLFPILFCAFYMRVLAGGMNFVNLNDEGRISSFLEIGTFTLPVIVSVALFLMVYGIAKKHDLRWKFSLITFLVIMITSSALILTDQFYGIRIL